MTKSVKSEISRESPCHYIPNKVDKSINLPINKTSSDFKKVKDEIISNIEDGICEIEYFNLDYAREHIETALYYIRNING